MFSICFVTMSGIMSLAQATLRTPCSHSHTLTVLVPLLLMMSRGIILLALASSAVVATADKVKVTIFEEAL